MMRLVLLLGLLSAATVQTTAPVSRGLVPLDRLVTWSTADRARAQAYRQRVAQDTIGRRQADTSLASQVMADTLGSTWPARVVVAEQSNRFRGPAPEAVISDNPTIIVTTPQIGGATTSQATIQLGGSVSDANGIDRVDIDCTLGCSTVGGAAVIDSQSGTFTFAPVVAGNAVLFQHDFTTATNQHLDLLTPQIGTAWVDDYYLFSPGTIANYCEARNHSGGGDVRPFVSENDGAIIFCRATHATALNAALNYTQSLRITGPPPSGLTGSGGAGDGKGLIFGGTDASNICGLTLYYSPASPDVVLWQRAAGVASDFAAGTADVGPLDNDVWTLHHASDDTVTVQRNDVTVLTKNVGTACRGTIHGLHFGAGRQASDDASIASRLDDYSLTDHAAAASTGIALAMGANVIRLRAYDTLGNLTTITYPVQRVATDTDPPQISQNTPVVAGATHQSSSLSQTYSGAYSDTVGPVTVTYNCSGATTCGVTAATTTGTATAGTWTFTKANFNTGTTTVVVTATDGNSNAATASSTLMINVSDITNPTISISIPASEPYTAPTSGLVPFQGTAADNVALASPAVTCANDRGGSYNATGAAPWDVLPGIQMFNGTNIITCTARDTNNNPAQAQRTVNWVQPLAISTNTALPTGTDNVAYTAYISAVGGNGPGSYAWTESVALSADADCAGLTFSDDGGALDRGKVSGTPTAPVGSAVTCGFTAQVNDGTGPITKAFTIVLNQTGATTSQSYFETHRLASYCKMALSFRPSGVDATSPIQNCGNPHYYKTLLRGGLGGFTLGGSDTTVYECTYAPGSDTDPDKQDAMKCSIPPFTTSTTTGNEGTAIFRLGADIAADAGLLSLTIQQPNAITCSFYNTATSIKIDDEIMGVASCNETTNILTVDGRAQFGSPLQAHTTGTRMERNLNSLPANPLIRLGGALPPANQVYVNDGTDDGFVNVFIWQNYFTNSYRQNGLSNYKCIRFDTDLVGGSNGLHPWLEPNCFLDVNLYSLGLKGTPCANAGNASIYAFNASARTYDEIQALPGITNWLSTTSDQAHPTVRVDAPMYDVQTGSQCVPYAKWATHILRIKQVALDWDEITYEVCVEGVDCRRLFSKILLSVNDVDAARNGRINAVYFPQMNTSTDAFVRGTVGGSPDGLRHLVSYWKNFLWLRVPIGDTRFDDLADGGTFETLFRTLPVRD